MLPIVLLLFPLLMTVAYIWILYYLIRLEQTGCACALNWRRDYIMGFIIFIFITQIIAFFTHKKVMAGAWLSGILFVLSIANMVIMFQYIHYLKEQKCKCSDDSGKKVMQIVAIFQICMTIFGALTVLYLGMHLFNTQKKIKK